MQIKITTAYAILAALATSHAAPIAARSFPLLDSTNVLTGGHGDGAGGVLNILDINKVGDTTNLDQTKGNVDALNILNAADSLNPSHDTTNANTNTKTTDNMTDIPVDADNAYVEALETNALNGNKVTDSLNHNHADNIVKDNHVHDINVGDIKPVNVEANNNKIANNSGNNNDVLSDILSPKIANDSGNNSANGNGSHDDTTTTIKDNVKDVDVKDVDVIKGNGNQSNKQTSGGSGGGGGSGGNGGAPCKDSDCSIVQKINKSLIDLDIKDIKVDKVDVDLLGKVSHLLSLYPKKTDFKNGAKPYTVPKGQALPGNTFACGTRSGGTGPAGGVGKLLSRSDNVDLCMLVDSYDKRPLGSIACPGEMQRDPLKKLLKARDMDESNQNDSSWDVMDSPSESADGQSEGGSDMRKRLNIDGDIRLCLADKKH